VTRPVTDVSRRMLLPAALASLFMVAGCGIKGPLELPTEAEAKAKASTGKGEYPITRQLPGYQPSQQQRKEAKQLGSPQKPDEPFFLDPLLK
jgi:predicted small lipoprotein YifL